MRGSPHVAGAVSPRTMRSRCGKLRSDSASGGRAARRAWAAPPTPLRQDRHLDPQEHARHGTARRNGAALDADDATTVCWGTWPVRPASMPTCGGIILCGLHSVMADDAGRLHRVKIVDSSFFTWAALVRAAQEHR